jgi:hypothetical protein
MLSAIPDDEEAALVTSESKIKTPGRLVFCLCMILPLAALLAACQPANQAEGSAEKTLQDYFAALNAGQYQQMEQLFGGEYGTLTGWNPEIDPGDHAALWEAGCTRNGLQCLAVRSLSLREKAGDLYYFTVEFTGKDGDLFVRRPCCGATETEMPSISKFEYRVQESADGKYLVLDLPVYIP